MLKQIEISGFKSIRHMKLELRPLNVLIGPNGAGKSNLVAFVQMLRWMLVNGIQSFIGKKGGASSLLHYGPKITNEIQSMISIAADQGTYEYGLHLEHAALDTFYFAEETIELQPAEGGPNTRRAWGAHRESRLTEHADHGDPIARVIRFHLQGTRIFHFHDTSETSGVRQSISTDQNQELSSDGGNLAAILYRIRKEYPAHYGRIVAIIQQMAPYFGDFSFPLEEEIPRTLLLRWRQLNPSTDYAFGPHQLSDGTLRAMLLITLLLQPREMMPKAIILDEPELGLHPYAIHLLASIIKETAEHTQIILATQSPTLLEEFDPDDVIVVDYERGESKFRRLETQPLEQWLEDYTLGELWGKNVLGGGPSR